MKSVVGERGQVTIPKKLRDRLGIKPGQTLDFEEDHGRLIARKVNPVDGIDKVYGILDLGDRTTDEIIAEMRGDYLP
jgi:antitoxin PrlF